MWIMLDKVSRGLGIIAKLKYFVSMYTLLTICRSQRTPCISYGFKVAWDQASKCYIDKLLKLQLFF